MKINSVKGYEAKTVAPKGKTSFKGANPTRFIEDAKEIGTEIANHSKPFANLLSKLKDGEVMNILTTAFGTAVVAPIFIAFNPLSKKDKETKMYSALRQPISAAIAVGAQLGVVKTFNNYLDKLASTGVVEKMNLADKPQESYLRKMILLENPNISKEDLAAEIKRRQGTAFEEAVRRNAEALTSKPTDEILTTELLSVKDVTRKKEELIRAFKEKIKAGTADMSLREYKKKIKTEKLDIKGALDDIQTGIREAAKKTGGNLDEALREETIKQYTRQTIAKAGDMLGSMKKYGGIVLSLLTLPVTCGILNWAYPRIVEKFFPSLAKSKSDKQAPPPNVATTAKKAEV